MGVIIPVGFFEATQEFHLLGSSKTFSVVTGHNTPPATSVTTMAQNVNDFWTQAFQWPTAVGTAWTLGKTTARYRTDPFTVEIGEYNVPLQGTAGTNTTMPPNVAILAQKRTGLVGRKFRGRFYVPPYQVQETDVDYNGVMNAANLAAQQAAFDDFLARTQVLPYDLMLFHSDGTLPTPVTSIVVQPLVATQRRRLR